MSLEWFRSRAEARVVIEAWRRHYNEVRPHSSLGYLTPAEFVANETAASVQATGRDAAVDGASAPRPVAPPFQRVLEQAGLDAVEIGTAAVRLRAGTMLTLNGIAHGHMTDKVAERSSAGKGSATS